MHVKSYHILGVMSGTSLDGIDLAQMRLQESDGKWSYTLGICQTIPYTNDWVARLQSAVGFTREALLQLNDEYTLLLASVICDFITQHPMESLDAVCSHGHTILHQPQNGLTLQIGNLPNIARLTGQKVVCDFRVQDVQMGGQGAPLVPIGDRMLFASYDYCLNLGGFSNVSFEQNGQRIAFDISAVNTVLNHYTALIGKTYDDRGHIAASGSLDLHLLDALNAWDFYTKPFPKSLGFESVKNEILPMIDGFNLPVDNILHTFCQHIGKQIAGALPQQIGRLLVTGGGAYNDFLINCIKQNLPEMTLVIPDAKTLEYKEALIFGLLGVLKLRGDNNVLASVTGAARDHSSGVVFS